MMKFFAIVLSLLILLAGPVVAEENDNLSLLYEHKVEGDNALGLTYSWGRPYATVFLAHGYWEAYFGLSTPLPWGFTLASAAAVNGVKSPLRIDALMPTLTITGHEVEIDNYLNFFYQPVLSLKNKANFNDIRWSWTPLQVKGVRFGPLMDGNLSLFNRDCNALTAGIRLTYEREKKETWGSWAVWLYLSSGVNKDNRGQGMARFQVRLAI